jgi:hypothetical protein
MGICCPTAHLSSPPECCIALGAVGDRLNQWYEHGFY